MKTEATDGYSAVQVGYNQTNVPGKVNKPEMGHLAKSGAPPLRTLQEFRVRPRTACLRPVRAARAASREPRAPHASCGWLAPRAFPGLRAAASAAALRAPIARRARAKRASCVERRSYSCHRFATCS